MLGGGDPLIKVIAIGDVHGQWPELWRVLKASSACTAQLEPSEALREGRFRVVCVGDLVHYKDDRAYAQAVGEEPFDPRKPDHLRRSARAQIRELYRFKDFCDRSAGNVQVILGNHDEVALEHNYELVTRGGTLHNEFNPACGGVELPEDLQEWLRSFPREVRHFGVHFAHAGPLPGMMYYDDFFYHDGDARGWWRDKPELVRQAGHRFGVYGHTPMVEGIYLDKENAFAMIDALSHLQYMEMILSEERLDYTVLQL